MLLSTSLSVSPWPTTMRFILQTNSGFDMWPDQ